MILNKKGNSSIAVVIFITAIIALMYFLAVLVTVVPKFDLDREVTTLSDIVQKKGGLPQSDMEDFINRICSKYSYLEDQSDKIQIDLYTEKSKTDCSRTADLNEEGFFIDSSMDDIMVLEISVPSNNLWLNHMASIFESDEVPDMYKFNRHIVSKREIKQ